MSEPWQAAARQKDKDGGKAAEGATGKNGKRCHLCGATGSGRWYGVSAEVRKCDPCYAREYNIRRRQGHVLTGKTHTAKGNEKEGDSAPENDGKKVADLAKTAMDSRGEKQKQKGASPNSLETSPKKKGAGHSLATREPGLCIDCGATESSSWHRGPGGPKTQCRKCHDLQGGGPCHVCGTRDTCMWYGGPKGPKTTCSTCYRKYLKGKKDGALAHARPATKGSKRAVPSPQKTVNMDMAAVGGVSLDSELVSRRVGIWWPIDGVYNKGRVIRYTKWNSSHEVLYDDGAREFLTLAKEHWKLLESDDESESEEEGDEEEESEGEEESEEENESEEAQESEGMERGEEEARAEQYGREENGAQGGGQSDGEGETDTEETDTGIHKNSSPVEQRRRGDVSAGVRKTRARSSGGVATGASSEREGAATGDAAEGGLGAEREQPPAGHGQEIVSAVLKMVSEMDQAGGSGGEGLERESSERDGGSRGEAVNGETRVGVGAADEGAAGREAGLAIVTYQASPFAGLVQPQPAPWLPRLDDSSEGFRRDSTSQPPAHKARLAPSSESVRETPPVAADAATEGLGEEPRAALGDGAGKARADGQPSELGTGEGANETNISEELNKSPAESEPTNGCSEGGDGPAAAEKAPELPPGSEEPLGTEEVGPGPLVETAEGVTGSAAEDGAPIPPAAMIGPGSVIVSGVSSAVWEGESTVREEGRGARTETESGENGSAKPELGTETELRAAEADPNEGGSAEGIAGDEGLVEGVLLPGTVWGGDASLQRAESSEGRPVVAGAGASEQDAGKQLAEAEPDHDEDEPQGDQANASQPAAEGGGQIVVASEDATWQPEEGSLWAAYAKQLLPGGFLWGAYADALPSESQRTFAARGPSEDQGPSEQRGPSRSVNVRAADTHGTSEHLGLSESQWASERPHVCANCGFCEGGAVTFPGGPPGRLGMPLWGGAEPCARVPISVLREWIQGAGGVGRATESPLVPAVGSRGTFEELELTPRAGMKRGRQWPGASAAAPLQIRGPSSGGIAEPSPGGGPLEGSLKRARGPGGSKAAGGDVRDNALRGGAAAAVGGDRVVSLGDSEVG
ncbi:hypothetical protein KFL_012320020 [Klebsormidium nitens]|uniref:GATA-type domain-containing protein n=1 Tax=Klebsormidium nitens TaxID=105231 RepID=A0A1Y1IW71_KLENI|nr:hypothetical protein KFL_012320020 [Klebsormidium nitens]|eukprot:GAQ92977.1 hypothetical protein KFL_012320020 [Klebsormidium nitens]